MAAEEGMAPSALRVLEEALGVGLTSAGATAEAVAAEGAYYLEQVTITEASEDDYEYEEIPDDNFSIPEGEEDLAKAIHMVQEQAIDTHILEQKTVLPSKPVVPEVIEDFLCNFLIKMGMTRTLDCFQSECVMACLSLLTQLILFLFLVVAEVLSFLVHLHSHTHRSKPWKEQIICSSNNWHIPQMSFQD
uniref:Sperm associated antigen 16 n=1 Tax=Equus caballus TaxID=9796 RepID=A0A3Q2GZ37_HORSE